MSPAAASAPPDASRSSPSAPGVRATSSPAGAARGRRLGPVFAPVGRFASWIAPYITGALMFVIKLFAALIALLAELGAVAGQLARRPEREARDRHGSRRCSGMSPHSHGRLRRDRGRGRARGLAVLRLPRRRRGRPELRRRGRLEAPAPIVGSGDRGQRPPLGAHPGRGRGAVVLIIGAYRGERRLAGAVAICGLLGLAVALAIDLPQGLDAGRPGLAFSGSQAELLQGFWAEVACSAVLILCGGLLAHYSRGVAAERRGGSRRAGARGRASGRTAASRPACRPSHERSCPARRPCSSSPARPRRRCSASRSSPTSSI